jgi:predicted nucleotide-binding protein (sugar kinase/HSP70/actin superfamily)
MWKTFFEHLGAELVVSPPTTKAMLATGISRVVAETCLPVKAFMGHVHFLADKCDYMFVPAIRSVREKIHNCSKFLGLPDMTRAAVPESPPILEIEIDVDKGKRELYRAIYELGRRFTWNPLKVKQAAEAAWQVHLNYRAQMQRRQLTPLQAIKEMCGEAEGSGQDGENPQAGLTLAIIGHPYLIYDDYISYRLFSRLQSMGARIRTAEMVEEEKLEQAIVELVEKPYWTFESDVVGAGGYYLETQVDGVISILSFGCGPDSVMIDVVQRHARRLKKPFMSLTLDEHTAETGLLTRLEAFIDMIQRRKRGKEICG